MKLFLISFLLIVSASTALSMEKKVTLFQIAEELPIEALLWKKKEILSEAEGRLLLTGEFKNEKKKLFLNGKAIVLDENSIFKIAIVLDRKTPYSFFRLEAKGSGEKTQSQTVVLGIDATTQEPSREQKKVVYPPVQVVTDLGELVPAPPLRWSASLATGPVFFSIEQPRIPGITQANLFLEGTADAIVFKDHGILGSDFHIDALNLNSGTDGRNLRMISLHPYAGGRFSNFFGERSICQFDLGLLYSTSYANTDDFGYADLYSPAFGVKGSYRLSDHIGGGLRIVYALAKSAQSNWSLSNADWSFEMELKVNDLIELYPVSVFLRYHSLSLELPTGAPLYRHSGVLVGFRVGYVKE